MGFDKKAKWTGIDDEIEYYEKAIKEHQKEEDFSEDIDYTPKELFEIIIKILKRVKKNMIDN